MKPTSSTLKPSPVNVDILDGLIESLREARDRWRTLDRQGIRAVFRELQDQREHLIRQEDLYPPNDPRRRSVFNRFVQKLVDKLPSESANTNSHKDI